LDPASLSLSAISQREKAKPKKKKLFRFQNLLWLPLSPAGKVTIFTGKSLHFSAGLPLVLVGLYLTFPRKRSPFSSGNLSLAGFSHFSLKKVSIFSRKCLPRRKIFPLPEKLSLARNLFLTKNLSLARKAPLSTVRCSFLTLITLLV
jgi:hypothetical protein